MFENARDWLLFLLRSQFSLTNDQTICRAQHRQTEIQASYSVAFLFSSITVSTDLYNRVLAVKNIPGHFGSKNQKKLKVLFTTKTTIFGSITLNTRVMLSGVKSIIILEDFTDKEEEEEAEEEQWENKFMYVVKLFSLFSLFNGQCNNDTN